jgi:hypothetical protein
MTEARAAACTRKLEDHGPGGEGRGAGMCASGIFASLISPLPQKAAPWRRRTAGLRRAAADGPSRCNTLQHAATRCNSLQLAATRCNTLQHTATRGNTLQHTATCCNTLQHAQCAASRTLGVAADGPQARIRAPAPARARSDAPRTERREHTLCDTHQLYCNINIYQWRQASCCREHVQTGERLGFLPVTQRCTIRRRA